MHTLTTKTQSTVCVTVLTRWINPSQPAWKIEIAIPQLTDVNAKQKEKGTIPNAERIKALEVRMVLQLV